MILDSSVRSHCENQAKLDPFYGGSRTIKGSLSKNKNKNKNKKMQTEVLVVLQ